MIDKKSILKMTQHVFRKSKGYPDRRLMHPKREWGIGLLMFAGIVVLGSVVAGNIFNTYQNIDGEVDVSNESVPKYRSVIIQDALEMNRQQAQKYKLLREKQVFAVEAEEVASSTTNQNEPVIEPIDEIELF